MNILNRLKPIFLFLIVMTFSGCQQDTFDIPIETGEEENKQLNTLLAAIEKGEKSLISVSQLKEYFVYRRVHTFTSPLVVKGYVVSSDRTGNFYKEFYLQDAFKKPTAAIHVMIDQTNSYSVFNMGREVYIDLEGLHIGELRRGNGIISIGGALNRDGDEVESIRTLDIPYHIFRSKTTEDIVPLPVSFSEINERHIGMFVTVENVRVFQEHQGKPFVDPRDYYDTRRILEACEGTAIVPFLIETSAFATYRDVPLPMGTGTIRGIVSKTYNGSDFVLTLNDATDAMLTGTDCQ